MLFLYSVLFYIYLVIFLYHQSIAFFISFILFIFRFFSIYQYYFMLTHLIFLNFASKKSLSLLLGFVLLGGWVFLGVDSISSSSKTKVWVSSMFGVGSLIPIPGSWSAILSSFSSSFSSIIMLLNSYIFLWLDSVWSVILLSSVEESMFSPLRGPSIVSTLLFLFRFPS